MNKAKNQASESAPRERILAAAERLFASKGLHGAGLREIARESGVNVNGISYHFKTKEALYSAVMDARAKQLNEMRADQLEKLDHQYSPGVAPVSEIFRAFVHPVFVLRARDPAIWTNFSRAYLRETGTPIWHEHNERCLTPALRRFTTALHRSLPSAKRVDIIFLLEMALRCQTLAADPDDVSIMGKMLAEGRTPIDLENQLILALSGAATRFS